MSEISSISNGMALETDQNLNYLQTQIQEDFTEYDEAGSVLRAALNENSTLNTMENPATVATEKDLARHLALLEDKAQLMRGGGTQLVLIGDSITESWNVDPQRKIFEACFGTYRPFNMGISGDETQHVLWRIQHGELEGIAPKFVILLIGTNNLGNANMTPEQTSEGVRTLLNAIQDKLPTSKILLFGIFPRGEHPDHLVRCLVNQTNAELENFSDNQNIFYLDISDKFLDENGFLSDAVGPDYVHLNPQGYQIWADAIKSFIDQPA